MTPEELYLHNGTFDPEAVISHGRLSIADTLQKGFKALRCACDMTWVKTYKIAPKTLLDYEAKVSCLFEDKLVSICQYSTHVFDEQTIDSLLQSSSFNSWRRHRAQPDVCTSNQPRSDGSRADSLELLLKPLVEFNCVTVDRINRHAVGLNAASRRKPIQKCTNSFTVSNQVPWKIEIRGLVQNEFS